MTSNKHVRALDRVYEASKKLSQKFKLKSKDFYEITRRTLAATNEFTKGKVISILEGGYDLNALSESANEHVNALVEFN